MKRFIVTEKQLNEYVEKKKTKKIFNNILEDMYKNSKNLSENISINKANQTIIENYKRKKLITPKVQKLLEKYNLFNENTDIL